MNNLHKINGLPIFKINNPWTKCSQCNENIANKVIQKGKYGFAICDECFNKFLSSNK